MLIEGSGKTTVAAEVSEMGSHTPKAEPGADDHLGRAASVDPVHAGFAARPGVRAPRGRPLPSCLLALACAVCSLALTVPAAQANPGYAILEYKGTMSYEDAGEGHAASYKGSFAWDATATVDFESDQTPYWHFKSVTGTVWWSEAGPGQGPCEASLSFPHDEEMEPADAIAIEQDPAGEPGPGYVKLSAGINQVVAESSDHNDDTCKAEFPPGISAEVGRQTFFYGPAGPGYTEAIAAAANAASFPQVTDPPGGPWTTAFNFSGVHHVPMDCTGIEGSCGPYLAAESLTINSTLTVTSTTEGSAPGGTTGPLFGPPLRAAKEAALGDLRDHAVPNAEHYCLPFAGELGLAGAGLLTLGLGPGSGMLVMSGTLTASALAPFCTATITRLVKDYRSYKDPPLYSVREIARPAKAKAAKLPSCKRYRRRVARVCKRLRVAYQRLDRAAENVAALATATEETVSRDHAAEAEGDQAAGAAQNAELGKLSGEFASANAAEERAGRAVAKVLRGIHARFKLSEKNSAKAIKLVEGKLAKYGITAAELKAVDSAVLKPAATNLLSDLDHL